MKFLTKSIFILIGLLFLFSCQKNEDSNSTVLKKRKNIEPNLNKRAEDYAAKGGGIMSQINKSRGSGNFEFATANVLWRASLKTLDFIPLQSANYSGGVLVTDWYSGSLNSDSSIKIEVRFKATEIATSSFDVLSYKRTCKNMNCATAKLGTEFNNDIKSKILNNARKISIQDEKVKEKK